MSVRRVASVGKQISILLWKNWVLFKRNLTATLVELIASYAFLLLLILLRYFVDNVKNLDQNNPVRPVLDGLTFSSAKTYILYYPPSQVVQELITTAVDFINRNENTYYIAIPTNVSSGFDLNSTVISSLFAMVSFPDNYTSNELPKSVEYIIYSQELARFRYYIQSNYVDLNTMMYSNSPEFYCFNQQYTRLYTTTFNPLKFAIDMAITSYQTNYSFIPSLSQVQIAQFNCPGYTNDMFKSSFSFFPRIIINFAFLFTLLVNLGDIIKEKTTKMKEYLKMMGIKWYAIWISWIIRLLLFYLVLTVFLTIISKIQLNPRRFGPKKSLLMSTSWPIAFATFSVYSIQVTTFTLMLGQLFSNSFLSKITSILIWIISVLDFFGSSPTWVKYLFCCLPNWGFLFAFTIILQYERSSIPFNVQNMYTNIFNDSLNLGMVLAFQLAWAVFYLPIAWYVERIMPGEYGAPLPLYFPFMPSYWLGTKRSTISPQSSSVQNEGFGFESDPAYLNATISIQNLSKKFKSLFRSKEKYAVDDVSINFYENQITALLGHNGAGKTTTTFILCGIYAPTSGDVFMMGKSIKTDLDEIRLSLGFCPQYNIQYDELTVEEHIDLIASIKGFSRKEIKNEILKISESVGLAGDLKKTAKQLSGGMRRRLSVAMALTGDAKIIILDEPSSGLDIYNRRMLWELIRKFKNGRTIILTTHFMEEADALSDRIAIMNHGKVKCCGTPLFLKGKYGTGFRLSVSKKFNGRFESNSFKQTLSSFVNSFVVESDIAAEMYVRIPFDQNDKLAELLKNIEDKKVELGIENYGISSPSIEEVFIKVGSIDANSLPEHETQTTGGEDLSLAFTTKFTKSTGIGLWACQMSSLWKKRFKIFYRRYIVASVALFGPLLLEIVFFSLIPSETNLISSLANSFTGSHLGQQTAGSSYRYKLAIDNYHSYSAPYAINSSSSISYFVNSVSSMPGVNLMAMNSNSINTNVLQLRKNNFTKFINDYFVGFSLNQYDEANLSANIYYSSLALHSSANILDQVDNWILQTAMNDSDYRIKTYNSPLPADTNALTGFATLLEILACLDILPLSLLNFIISLIAAFLVGIVGIHAIRERSNGSKQLQYLTGTHYSTYWISNYLFDWPILLYNILCICVVIVAVNAIKSDSSNELWSLASDPSTMWGLFLLLFFSSITWAPWAYAWSFLFKSEIIGFVFIFLMLGLLTYLDTIITFIQIFIINGTGRPNTASNILGTLRLVLAFLVPTVSIKRGIYDLKIHKNDYCINATNQYLGVKFKSHIGQLSMTEPGIGLMIVYSIGQFILLNIVIILAETRFHCCSSKSIQPEHLKTIEEQNLEEDVKAESNRIRDSDLKQLATKEPLVVHNLVKYFPKSNESKMAVKSLSFGVSDRECFGLLGFNGAGKTTTFKMLTGELRPTLGTAYINGYDIDSEQKKACHNLAFCPQFDYLPDYLTVGETLNLFAGLRGLARLDAKQCEQHKACIDSLLNLFKINEFKNQLNQALSGGNRRKVSSAISFIGRPSVVFLDEPSTGMDPAARRNLWQVIKKARDSGVTIVLTSHSMDECEALSNRLGIMVAGQFKCLGSVQHLKNKFGQGYTLVLKCKRSPNSELHICKLEDFIAQRIRQARLKDKQQDTLFYEITRGSQSDSQTIAELFSMIEENKNELNIETFSLSQTTLEQVFLSFADQHTTQS